jgi:acyl-CoA synthetase (AMP-forming)/AMP-acid ligase II
MPHPLGQRITDVLRLAPESPAIQFEGRWWSWRDVGDHADRIAAVIEGRGGQGVQVGVLLRNSPAHVATLLGIMMAGATLVVINPARGDHRTRADVSALALPIAVGTADDIATVIDSADTTTVVTIAVLGQEPIATRSAATPLGTVREGDRPGVAVRMLTSGTTGPPKRIDLTYGMLAHSVLGRAPASAPAPTEPRHGVAIVNAPLVHIGGVFRVLQCVTEARPFVLLPRFELSSWIEAVRAYRPKAVSLVPAALRTVLHSDLTRDDLAGVRAVTSGTAPLSADDADAFTEKFGVPVLTSYAATEFGGGVAGWTLADHQRYWKTKRGSVGRASLGARLRVVDDHGGALAPGETGLLEVKPGQMGSETDWIRTTDEAYLDADGFLWILGRADQAIIRGGFKVMPDDVRTALENHPAVRGAVVVGRPDQRLGETPVAMVELRIAATTEDLVAFLRNRLAPYEIPTDIAVVDAIPRTPSGKADLSEVKRHFASAVATTRGGHAG